MTAPEPKYPTEIIDLPSKGWFYQEGHPLATGQIEMYYMTARHEDILTSRNLIQKGVVIDKLLDALIVNKGVKLDDVLLCDKNAMMIAARILGYGKDYPVDISCPSCEAKFEHTIDLQEIGERESPLLSKEFKGKNAFSFTLPVSKKVVEFKLLTHGDEKNIRAELEGLKKITKSDVSKEATTRLRYSLVSVDGETDGKKVRDFIDVMPARDAHALREHIRTVTPDVDLTSNFECMNCEYEGRVDIPIDINFFWPGAKV